MSSRDFLRECEALDQALAGRSLRPAAESQERENVGPGTHGEQFVGRIAVAPRRHQGRRRARFARRQFVERIVVAPRRRQGRRRGSLRSPAIRRTDCGGAWEAPRASQGLASPAGNSSDGLWWRLGGAKSIAVTRVARDLGAELLAVEETVDVVGGGPADAVDGAKVLDGGGCDAVWGAEGVEKEIGSGGADAGDGLEEEVLLEAETSGAVAASAGRSGRAALELVGGVEDERGGFLGGA